MKTRIYFVTMLVGGVIGMTSAFLQTLEKLVLMQDSNAVLPCNLNAIFSCSTVLKAWQSSVFGFPNSIMCLVLFTIFTTAAAAGLGAELHKYFRMTIQAMALATLGFALWFLWQSTYVIGALCIFCLFCFAGLLLINWAWLRMNIHDIPVGEKVRLVLQRMVAAEVDNLIWLGIGVGVGLLMLARFTS